MSSPQPPFARVLRASPPVPQPRDSSPGLWRGLFFGVLGVHVGLGLDVPWRGRSRCAGCRGSPGLGAPAPAAARPPLASLQKSPQRGFAL